MILIKYSFSRCSIGIISSQDDADVFDNKVVATRGTAQIIVKSSVFEHNGFFVKTSGHTRPACRPKVREIFKPIEYVGRSVTSLTQNT